MQQTLTCGCILWTADVDPTRGATIAVETYTIPCEGHRIRPADQGSD